MTKEELYEVVRGAENIAFNAKLACRANNPKSNFLPCYETADLVLEFLAKSLKESLNDE